MKKWWKQRSFCYYCLAVTDCRAEVKIKNNRQVLWTICDACKVVNARTIVKEVTNSFEQVSEESVQKRTEHLVVFINSELKKENLETILQRLESILLGGQREALHKYLEKQKKKRQTES